MNRICALRLIVAGLSRTLNKYDIFSTAGQCDEWWMKFKWLNLHSKDENSCQEPSGPLIDARDDSFDTFT